MKYSVCFLFISITICIQVNAQSQKAETTVFSPTTTQREEIIKINKSFRDRLAEIKGTGNDSDQRAKLLLSERDSLLTQLLGTRDFNLYKNQSSVNRTNYNSERDYLKRKMMIWKEKLALTDRQASEVEKVLDKHIKDYKKMISQKQGSFNYKHSVDSINGVRDMSFKRILSPKQFAVYEKEKQ